MKKLYYLIILALILVLVLTGCSLLSNIGQAPATDQSGITYLTKGTPSGLVGWWRFDGDATDSSVYGNDGTVYGVDNYVPSPMGQALSFAGDDYVKLPATKTILNTNTFTIEAWFKTSVNHPVYGGKEGRLVNLHWKDTASTAVSLYVEQDKIGLLYHEGSMHHVFVKHKVNYFDNTWHHIAVTYDASIYRLYYDGAEVASQAGAFGGFGIYPAYLGTYNGSQRFFNGTIDEVRIWNRALTDNELIRYGFNGLLAPYKEPPKAFKIGSSIPLKWQYTDFAGTVVDSSATDPSVEIKPVEFNGAPVEGTPIEVDDPGSSGLRYDSDTKTWHFNWQTKELEDGRYHIWITSGQTLQVNGSFLIELR